MITHPHKQPQSTTGRCNRYPRYQGTPQSGNIQTNTAAKVASEQPKES